MVADMQVSDAVESIEIKSADTTTEHTDTAQEESTSGENAQEEASQEDSAQDETAQDETAPPDTLQTAEYKAPDVDYTAANVKAPTVQLKAPSEIAAQVKAAVDGNVPRIIDARNLYEPQQETMSEAERATMIENIRRSINHENPRVIDVRNRYEPQQATMSESERTALSDRIWRSINHETPRYYDARNQGGSNAPTQKTLDQTVSKVYNQDDISVNARINALNQEVQNEQQNVNNVASLIRIQCIRQELAGKRHPKTGVLYTERIVTIDGRKCIVVAPQFDSLFDTQLPDELRYASDDVQFRCCTYQLRDALEANPELKAQFTQIQLWQINHGIKPNGYTWHHDVEVGKMQLVLTEIHQKTGHTGGRSLWGGGSKYR